MHCPQAQYSNAMSMEPQEERWESGLDLGGSCPYSEAARRADSSICTPHRIVAGAKRRSGHMAGNGDQKPCLQNLSDKELLSF